MAGKVQKANLIESYNAAEEDDEKQPASDPYAPVISETGAVGMSPREKELFDAQVAAAGTSPIRVQQILADRRNKEKEYQELTNKADEQVKRQWSATQGRGPLDFEKWSAYKRTPAYQEALKSASLSLLETKKSPLPALAPTVPVPTGEVTAAEVPEGEKAKEEPKPAPVAPPSAPEGGAPAVTAQPSAPAVDTASLKEPTKKVAQSQQNLPDALADFSIETNRLNLQNQYGKSVDRQTLKDAVTALGQVDDNIKKLYDNNPPPALADVTKARREALQAYKEKANLNEWLSIADRAINAIAQFASAQAAMGTPYVGSYRPSSTDYESRTAQALREYQAEAGLLKEEREESEKARAEDIRQKEQTGEQMRRAAEQQYRLAQEDIKEQEQAAAQADRMISDIFNANVSLIKNQQDLNAAVEKYRASQAKDDKEAQQKAGKSILELQLEKEKTTIQESQKLLKAANALAISPKDEKVLAEFLAAQGKSGETLQKEINERPEFWTVDKIKGLASATATQLEGNIQDANKRSAELSTKIQSLIAGGTIAPASTPAPGQQPAATGTMIKARVPGYPPVELTPEQFANAKKEYPNIEIVP